MIKVFIMVRVMPESTFLLVGLGNPGPGYERTRHNFGFLVVDEIRAFFKLPEFRLKGKSLITQGTIISDGIVTPVMLLKPQTYMNLSGEAVAEVARFYKIPLAHIFVFHDDIDLKLGQVRVKQGGGYGGHNGLKSVDALIGKEYWRVRLGVGHPGAALLVADYVLSNFLPNEQTVVEDMVRAVTLHLPKLVPSKDANRFSSEVGMR